MADGQMRWSEQEGRKRPYWIVLANPAMQENASRSGQRGMFIAGCDTEGQAKEGASDLNLAAGGSGAADRYRAITREEAIAAGA